MSTRNWNFQRKGSIKYTAKTALSTLTKSELDHGIVILNHTVAFLTTLPAASSLYKGCLCRIVNKGSGASTVTVAAGFGGGNATVTLAQGDMIAVVCDGAYWYVVHHTTAA